MMHTGSTITNLEHLVDDALETQRQISMLPIFDGRTYEPKKDLERLATQLEKVRELMLDHRWRTLEEIQFEVGWSVAGLSARIRDLRKLRNGSHTVLRRRRESAGAGVFEYKVPVKNAAE